MSASPPRTPGAAGWLHPCSAAATRSSDQAQRLTNEVVETGDGLTGAIHDVRVESRDKSGDDTRNTVILIIAGLAGGLLAAIVLFSGLVGSMRAPLNNLVEGARRLAGGDLGARVEAKGPAEIATLGHAFNDMASTLERDAAERDRMEQMKDDFLLTVSHELRTPVTSVKGFAEMLASQGNAPDRAPARGNRQHRRQRRGPLRADR